MAASSTATLPRWMLRRLGDAQQRMQRADATDVDALSRAAGVSRRAAARYLALTAAAARGTRSEESA